MEVEVLNGPWDITNSELEELRRVYSVGRAGNQDFIDNLTFQPLCSVNAEQAMARTWVITLLQQRFGRLSQGAVLAAGVAPDNQVITFGQGFYAVVQYGTGQVLENVLIDYPWAGATFQVNAAMVRVYAPNQQVSGITGAVPKVGAFISGDNCRLARNHPITFTAAAQNIAGAGGTAVFQAPARAVGYRPYEVAVAGGSLGNFQCNQITMTGGANATVCIDALAFVPDGTSPLVDGFFSTLPYTQGAFIINNDAALRQIGVVWELDLG